MALRQLQLYGGAVLQRPCREVSEVDGKVKEILSDMVETLRAAKHAAGLAAPQVGVLKRLVVIDMGEGLYQLVNPVIVGRSGVQECVEGCLSVPNIYGKTIRPQRVTVEALNENGEQIFVTGEGEFAKCLCHEIDHLDGILFLDRVYAFVSV